MDSGPLPAAVVLFFHCAIRHLACPSRDPAKQPLPERVGGPAIVPVPFFLGVKAATSG